MVSSDADAEDGGRERSGSMNNPLGPSKSEPVKHTEGLRNPAFKQRIQGENDSLEANLIWSSSAHVSGLLVAPFPTAIFSSNQDV